MSVHATRFSTRRVAGLSFAQLLFVCACSSTAEPPDGHAGSGNSAGNRSGGATSGGATSGGVTSGGASSGGATSGGATSGGATSGGATSGGATSGGATSGGATSGGATTGGITSKGGATSGGATTGGASTGASGSGGASAGSNSGGAKATGGTGGAAGGAGTVCGLAATDPKDILRMYRPKDSDLADLFDDYVDNTLGTLTLGTVGTGGSRTITQTILVPPCVTYDGKGEKLTAKGLGDGSQNEGQKPLFILTPGANILNVTITAPGCEGIHMMGNNKLDNIVWEDVGEDAASVRSYFPGGMISITGGSAKSAADKTFQFNAPSTVTIKNFKATDVSKVVRQNGGKDFPLTVTLDTVTATGVKEAVVMSDSSQCLVRYHALTTNLSDPFVGPMKVQSF